jgi:hypothetical protein
MEGFLGWVTRVVADFLDWVVGVWSLVVDEGGLHLQVMDFPSILMQFLLVSGGSGVFPFHLAENYCHSYCSPAGVQYDEGLVKRLQYCFLLYMICAWNYLCLMWRNAAWVGRDSVSHLGYEEWPLADPASFCKVARWAVSKGSSLDFIMHSIIGTFSFLMIFL